MDRVLEIGGYAAGYCGRLFKATGAQVLRADLQLPGAAAWPAWASEAAMDVYLHAGKQRLVVRDAALLARLAAAADVVVCEAPQAALLDDWGFDDWTASVKVALTPFGRTGPKRNWRATPSVILAMGGYTHLIGDADRAPLNLPGHFVEFQTGTLGFAAANASGYAARSAAIDISMLETVMSLSQFTTVRWHCAGELRSRHGSDFWFVVPSDLFACADGFVYLNIVPSFWDALTVFLQLPELAIDPRFANNDARMAHRQILHDIIAAVVAPLTRAELERRAESCRVPLGVVQSFDEVLQDRHLRERGFFQPVTDALGRSWDCPGLPFSYAPNEITEAGSGV